MVHQPTPSDMNRRISPSDYLPIWSLSIEGVTQIMENVTDKEDNIYAWSVCREFYSCLSNTTYDIPSLRGVETLMGISEEASLAYHVKRPQTGCGSLDPSQPCLDITLSARPE
jgi:hypothetical protein